MTKSLKDVRNSLGVLDVSEEEESLFTNIVGDIPVGLYLNVFNNYYFKRLVFRVEISPDDSFTVRMKYANPLASQFTYNFHPF